MALALSSLSCSEPGFLSPSHHGPVLPQNNRGSSFSTRLTWKNRTIASLHKKAAPLKALCCQGNDSDLVSSLASLGCGGCSPSEDPEVNFFFAAVLCEGELVREQFFVGIQHLSYMI